MIAIKNCVKRQDNMLWWVLRIKQVPCLANDGFGGLSLGGVVVGLLACNGVASPQHGLKGGIVRWGGRSTIGASGEVNRASAIAETSHRL